MLHILMRCKTTSDLYQAFEGLKFYGTSRSKANCQDSDQGSGYGQRLQMIDLAPEFRPREAPTSKGHIPLSPPSSSCCAQTFITISVAGAGPCKAIWHTSFTHLAGASPFLPYYIKPFSVGLSRLPIQANIRSRSDHSSELPHSTVPDMDCDTSTVVSVADTKASNYTDNAVKPTVRNQQSSDSMVTVRLSDPEPEVSIHNEITEEEALEEFPEMGDEEDFAAKTDNQIVYEHQAPMSPEEAKVVQRIHRDSVTSIQRESVLSMLSAVEEGGSDTASRTIRSRSDSSGTYSSNGSAHVDWDELDKSEEQAPRDEGSDEVRLMNP